MKTDEGLQQDVMAELRRESLLHACEIGVAVKDGVVTLTGQVDTPLLKMATERAAKRVPGVEVLAQEVTVKSRFGMEFTDEQIGHAIVSSFDWYSEVPRNVLTANVQQGWITLEGDVDWDYQRQAALWAVESLDGVKGVTNLIRVNTGQGVRL